MSTETSGFFNSKDGDRKYNAGQFGEIFDGVINDGVFASIGNYFVVRVGTAEDSRVIVGSGRAWFNHKWIKYAADTVIDLGQSDLLLPRYDAIVIEVNNEVPVRDGFITVIHGTPASTPQKPALIHTDNVNQYPLAYILRPANDDKAVAANITNTVGTSECPFVSAVNPSISMDVLLEQWKAEFNSWFSDVQDTLDSDTAGNLYNKINEVSTDVNTTIGSLSNLETNIKVNIVGAINDSWRLSVAMGSKLGDLSDLITNAKNNLVAAINECKSNANALAGYIGNLGTLKTSAKNNLVNAINELYNNIVNVNSNTIANTNSINSIKNSYVSRNPGLNEHGNIPTVMGQLIGQSTVLYRAIYGTRGFNQSINDINNYSRSLTGFRITSDANASDLPVPNLEYAFLYLRDDFGTRGMVVAFEYMNSNVWIRSYFDGAWKTDWTKIH